MKNLSFLLVSLFCLFLDLSKAQTMMPDPDPLITSPISNFSTASWCEDSGTICWRERDWFTGIRIVAEFDLGFMFQDGQNMFEKGAAKSLNKIALEVGVYRGWVSAQIGVFEPGMTKIDKYSPIVTGNKLNSARVVDYNIGHKYGAMLGLSFFDGLLAIGHGTFRYDKNYFDPNQYPLVNGKRDYGGDISDSFWYFSFQPVSGIRSVVKNDKTDNP